MVRCEEREAESDPNRRRGVVVGVRGALFPVRSGPELGDQRDRMAEMLIPLCECRTLTVAS